MYTQHAKGTFSIDVSGPNHCGPNHDTPKTFDYEVTLEYPHGFLDESGFLLDNTHFENYFRSLQQTDLSCELLAEKAAKDLHLASNKRCSKCSVAIWGVPNHAKVEYVHSVTPHKEKLGKLAELGLTITEVAIGIFHAITESLPIIGRILGL